MLKYKDGLIKEFSHLDYHTQWGIEKWKLPYYTELINITMSLWKYWFRLSWRLCSYSLNEISKEKIPNRRPVNVERGKYPREDNCAGGNNHTKTSWQAPSFPKKAWNQMLSHSSSYEQEGFIYDKMKGLGAYSQHWILQPLKLKVD